MLSKLFQCLLYLLWHFDQDHEYQTLNTLDFDQIFRSSSIDSQVGIGIPMFNVTR